MEAFVFEGVGPRIRKLAHPFQNSWIRSRLLLQTIVLMIYKLFSPGTYYRWFFTGDFLPHLRLYSLNKVFISTIVLVVVTVVFVAVVVHNKESFAATVLIRSEPPLMANGLCYFY